MSADVVKCPDFTIVSTYNHSSFANDIHSQIVARIRHIIDMPHQHQFFRNNEFFSSSRNSSS